MTYTYLHHVHCMLTNSTATTKQPVAQQQFLSQVWLWVQGLCTLSSHIPYMTKLVQPVGMWTPWIFPWLVIAHPQIFHGRDRISQRIGVGHWYFLLVLLEAVMCHLTHAKSVWWCVDMVAQSRKTQIVAFLCLFCGRPPVHLWKLNLRHQVTKHLH